MAIDFPSSPSVNDTFTSGSLVYTYDGTKWTAEPAGVTGGTKIEVGNTKAEIIDTGSDGRFVVTTEGTEALRVDSSRRLLVGTATARSNVSTPFGNITPQYQFEGTFGSRANHFSIINNSGVGFFPIFTLGRTGGSTVGSNTTVGFAEALGEINFAGSDGTNILQAASIRGEVDNASVSTNDMPGRLVFSTTADGASSPTERMRIASDGTHGFFGSGNAVIRSASSSAAGTTNVVFTGRHSATNTTNGTDSCYIFTNGNIQNTNNSYGSLSDIKLKENIVDANSQWDDLKALQVRKYNFKEGQTHAQIGLIAQEVELVSPGLVSESPDRDEDGNDLGTVTKSVNYSVLYMKAVKALQEAIERIETLEAKVAALES
jgi:hypothetical protein